MNKVKFFDTYDLNWSYKTCESLENKINDFGETHEIICVNITSINYGINNEYIAAVTYKEN